MVEKWGKYTLNKLLATGGMAEVFQAEIIGPSGFVKPVCLKRIRSDFSSNTDFVKMFEAEAKIAATLHHPNIVQVFDFDIHEQRLFLAMELVDGLDLHNILAQTNNLGLKLPIELTVHIMQGLLAALTYAHQRKAGGVANPVIHRDVSPHNILVSKDGIVKLADFGIAKAKGFSEETQAGMIKGKLAYLSPEQAQGLAINCTADLFAAGLVFFEMLTNKRALESGDDRGVISKIIKPVIPDVSGISAELNQIIHKLCAPNPVDRFISAEAAIAALRNTGVQSCGEIEAGRAVAKLQEYKSYVELSLSSTMISYQADKNEKADEASPPEPILEPTSEPKPGLTRGIEKSLHDERTRTSDQFPSPQLGEPASVSGSIWTRQRGKRIALTAVLVLIVVAMAIWIATKGGSSRIGTQTPGTGGIESKTAESLDTKPKTTSQISTPKVMTLSPTIDEQEVNNIKNEAKETSILSKDSVKTTDASADKRSFAGKQSTTADTEKWGTLEINVRPWAKVDVDGIDKGTTPLKDIRLKAGDHRVTLTNEELGYKKTERVKIREGKTTSLNRSISKAD